MAEDPTADRRRTREDEYFHKRDRELIEKMRRAAAADQARREIGERTGMTDPETIAGLESLGFTPDTVVLLPLIPLVEMAWAEGGVTSAERALVVELARTRGIAAGTPADQALTRWLDRRPEPEVFAKAGRLVAAMLDGSGAAGLSASDLINYCEAIAAASGGMFGIGKVSPEERDTLSRIVAALRKKG